MITIVNMIDLGTQPATNQVWIVPGSVSKDRDDGGEFEGVFITDYLERRGIYVGRRFDEETTGKLIERIKAKFEKVGMTVVVEVTAND